MAPTKERNKDRDKEREERKGTLPVGHPQAGYVSPDLSLQDDTGILPDEEQEWHDERDDAHEAEVEEVEKHEDEVVKEEREKTEELQKERDKQRDKEASTQMGTHVPATGARGTVTTTSKEKT